MGYDTLDLAAVASEWQEVLYELEGNVPNTEGMSYGEVAEATEAFLSAPEQIEAVAKYTELCDRLALPRSPDALEQCSVTLIGDGDFEDYARDLAESIGAISSDSGWPIDYIDWSGAADALRSDYTTIEWDGDTYLTNDL
jgi:hypothetical protein